MNSRSVMYINNIDKANHNTGHRHTFLENQKDLCFLRYSIKYGESSPVSQGRIPSRLFSVHSFLTRLIIPLNISLRPLEQNTCP